MYTIYARGEWFSNGLNRESEISEEGSKSILSTTKDREQIEYLINRYKESIDNLVDVMLALMTMLYFQKLELPECIS